MTEGWLRHNVIESVCLDCLLTCVSSRGCGRRGGQIGGRQGTPGQGAIWKLENHKRGEHGNIIEVYGQTNFIDIGETKGYEGLLLAPAEGFRQGRGCFSPWANNFHKKIKYKNKIPAYGKH